MAKNEKKKKTIGSVACDAILAGKSNEQALAAVKKAFPDSNTKLASMGWYRNKLKRDGHKLPDLPRGRKAGTAKK